MSTTPTGIPSDVAAAADVNEGWLGEAWESVKEFVGLGPEKEEPKKEKEEEKADLEKDLEKFKGEVKKSPSDKLIIAFQSFFSKSHPIIGKLYGGPKDGKMNPQLQAAAKAAEAKIGAEIGANVNGMVLATTPSDVQGALVAIVKHKEGGDKKSSFLSRDERIVAFSSIIHNK